MEGAGGLGREEVPRWLWVVGLLCAAGSAGAVCWLTFFHESDAVEPFGFAWVWLGVVHCAALLPALVVARVGWVRFLVLAVVGCTFPWWGFFLGMVLMLGPLMTGTAWGLLLVWVFARRASGWIAMGVNGVVSIFWIAGMFSRFGEDWPGSAWQFDVLVPVWHFAVTLGVYVGLYWGKPKRVLRGDVCVGCGFGVSGVMERWCPKCGARIRRSGEVHGRRDAAATGDAGDSPTVSSASHSADAAT